VGLTFTWPTIRKEELGKWVGQREVSQWKDFRPLFKKILILTPLTGHGKPFTIGVTACRTKVTVKYPLGSGTMEHHALLPIDYVFLGFIGSCIGQLPSADRAQETVPARGGKLHPTASCCSMRRVYIVLVKTLRRRKKLFGYERQELIGQDVDLRHAGSDSAASHPFIGRSFSYDDCGAGPVGGGPGVISPRHKKTEPEFPVEIWVQASLKVPEGHAGFERSSWTSSRPQAKARKAGSTTTP